MLWEFLYGKSHTSTLDNMLEVRLGKRGRVVIPSRIRKLLGLKEGTVLIMEVREGRIVLIPKRKVSIDDIFGAAGVGKVELEDVEGGLAGEEIR
ncbi:MAG: AbrB/MazE/SpoVT family DNA-binding domain-containing protein [Candidatus Korarchaeota archaeon]|nr:AbrB/MazE/SpoVT family DNA-binding domain-containing protein [Candidatus Korarchaeota archaeon]